ARAAGPGSDGADRRAAVHRAARLCPYARRAGAGARDAAPTHEATAHRRVRRGRRSRSRQARPDGHGGREARGHRDRHVGQSAHRGPGEDPRRRGGRHAGQAAHPRGRPPPGHRPRPRAGTAGRHDAARGERARDLPGDRDGEAAVRRAGDRAGAGGLVTQWTSARVAEALGVRAPAKLSFGDVATDTRDLRPGALFVALKGDRFDAHAFLDQARARGASAAVVRRGTPAVDGLPYFEVADTLDALVVEAGASVPGEIARLRAVIEPTIAVITNVGYAHVEGFGSLAGVMQEKLALVEGARMAVVGTDPPELASEARRRAPTVVAG